MNFHFIDELSDIKVTEEMLNAVHSKVMNTENRPIIISISPVGGTTSFLDMYKNVTNETTNMKR